MMDSYSDYVSFMEKQKIYLKEKPVETIPVEEKNWSINDKYGNIELKANINGPLCPELYFLNHLHILAFLREPYIKDDCWENGDRGGHSQSIGYGQSKWEDIGNKTYQNLIEFNFYLSKFLSGVNITQEDFMGDEAMILARNHLCVLNACWYPHAGITGANVSQCINWTIINADAFGKMIKLFSPSVVIGADILKPQWNASSETFQMFGLSRSGHLTSEDIASVTNIYNCTRGDSYLMSDNKIYINLYHPQANKFNPYESAKLVFLLLEAQKQGKLIWR